jgi:hypothetical protein
MNPTSVLVRDLRGAPLFYLEGDALRDENGKPVAARAGDDKKTMQLAEAASRWMRGDAVPSSSRWATDDAGRSVLMDLGQGDVAFPATQADFGIPARECVADRASAVRLVKRDRGFWFQESVADAIQIVDATAAEAGAPGEINPLYTKTAFTTVGYALAAKLPRLTVDNADFDLKKRATRRLVEALRLGREYRVATLLTTAANWAAGNQIAATAKWNGGVTANTLVDLFKALAASYLPASTLVIPENAAQYFYQALATGALSVRDYVQGGGEMPGRLFARAKYMVGGAPQYVWTPGFVAGTTPANVAVIREIGDPETDVPSSQTFRWLGADGARGDGTVDGMVVREWFEDRDDSYWITVVHNDAEVMPSNQVGALITGALA